MTALKNVSAKAPTTASAISAVPTVKRILMLAWEYPPRLVGGLARVVCAVSRELVLQGLEVHVVTADYPGAPEYEIDENGVHVHRVKTQTNRLGEDWKVDDFTVWVHRLNVGIMHYALKLNSEKVFDVVHAHDWLVADAAWMLSSQGLPLVATIHATEFGRNNGIHNKTSEYIDELEWRLIYESRRTIVNSGHMLAELTDHFRVPPEKVTVIPNGIDPDKMKNSLDPVWVRRKHNVGDGPVLLFVGRLVHEKGIQVLLDATPEIVSQRHDTTLIIAGAGYYEEELRKQAEHLGIASRVRFFGLANDNDLMELYSMATVLVVPSLYEPFGIVALEGMAAKVPVVTSDSGGLTDFVEHTTTGITTFAGDKHSLAWGIMQILDNPKLANEMCASAHQRVLEEYTWSAIARRTHEVYEQAVKDAAVLALN